MINLVYLIVSPPCRCEAVRHCRWVDEVVAEAPWIVDAAFLEKWEIDYIAHDDEPYPGLGHDDVYKSVKDQGVCNLYMAHYYIF